MATINAEAVRILVQMGRRKDVVERAVRNDPCCSEDTNSLEDDIRREYEVIVAGLKAKESALRVAAAARALLDAQTDPAISQSAWSARFDALRAALDGQAIVAPLTAGAVFVGPWEDALAGARKDFTATLKAAFGDKPMLASYALIRRATRNDIVAACGERCPKCPTCAHPMSPFAWQTWRAVGTSEPSAFDEERDTRILWACDTADCENGCDGVRVR